MRWSERIAALLFGLMLAGAANAQYKWVGPDGKINYSDLPPPPGTSAQSLGNVSKADAGATENAGLPASLRMTASKYPVVLYTAADCPPCKEAQAHLTRRGIPFSERTVATPADSEIFRKVGFTENRFPALTVGREKQVGFEPETWNRLLDAAGYPKTSQLPPRWRPAAAEPLAPVAKPEPGQPLEDAAQRDIANEKVRPRVRAENLPAPTPTLIRPEQAPGTIRF